MELHNCTIKSNYQSKSLWCCILFTQFRCVTNLSEPLCWTRLCRMRVKICLAATMTNWIIVLCHSVKLSQLLYTYEYSNIIESNKNCDVSCKSRTVCLFDDGDFDEQKGIKTYLQPLYLQNECKLILSSPLSRPYWVSNKFPSCSLFVIDLVKLYGIS